jgi:release factor glutamine methyltransferase
MTAQSQLTSDGNGSGDDKWTVQRILNWSVDYLKKRGHERARLDVELLLASCLNLSRIELYLQFDRPMSQQERDAFRLWLVRAGGGEPVAYILGSRDFYGRSFDVSPATLIPRPDTEVLVERTGDHLRVNANGIRRVLDIGTGTGCIAISLALEFPEIYFVAADISESALEIAHRNVKKHRVANIELVQGDVRTSDFWGKIGSVDLIVSNPPYIAESEKRNLPKSVIDYEPHQALFADRSGLGYYETILDFAVNALTCSGRVTFEVGHTQAQEVVDAFKSRGWSGIETFNDYGGRARVVTGTLQK